MKIFLILLPLVTLLFLSGCTSYENIIYKEGDYIYTIDKDGKAGRYRLAKPQELEGVKLPQMAIINYESLIVDYDYAKNVQILK